MIAAIAVSAIIAIAFRGHFELGAGVILLVTAETLIASRRLFSAGAEEALIVSAYVLIAVALTTIDHSVDSIVTFGVAVAIGLAGIRLLNPLLTTLGAMTISLAISFSLGLAIFHSSSMNSRVDLWVSIYCYGVAVVALVLGARQFQRPSHDRMLDWLVIIMPMTGYAWSINDISNGFYLGEHMPMQWYILLMPLFYAIACVAVGIRRRTHAPLFAAMGCIACVAYDLRNLTGMPLQWRLILWGSVMLVASTIAERLLRKPRRGITSQQLEDRNIVLDAAELAGTALITPADKQVAADTQPAMEGGGGSFSGGGASGKY